MSDRERWTVYPLLFLTIGLAMRAVLVPPATMSDIEAVRLVCREIVVEDEDGTVVLHLGRVAGAGGRLEINDRDGNALMAVGSRPAASSEDDKSGSRTTAVRPRAVIEFAGPDGDVVRRLTAETDDGP